MAISLKQRQHKYRAQPTVIDGIRFASKGESQRYGELKLLLRAGEIAGLELQPRFPLVVNAVPCGVYVADFMYFDSDGMRVVEDFKGMSTALYGLKKKLLKALYDIDVVEIRRKR
ncbi:MAG: DUF1064 domain-containing protein [Sulfuricaulis sp.]